MSASVIVVLVGIPGAGKTTFSNAFKTYFNEYQVTIFHYDELCKTFTADERKCVYEMVEKHITETAERTKTNIVIIDDNNYYKSMRYEYQQLCRKHRLGFVVVYFNVTLEKALEQNSLRDNYVPEEICMEMYEKLEFPVESENVIHIIDSYQFNDIRTKIEYAIANPLRPQPVKEIGQQTFSQQIDLVLRKIVNHKIQLNTTKAQEYNKIKKQLFKDIKENKICLSSCSSTSSLIEHELSKYFD